MVQLTVSGLSSCPTTLYHSHRSCQDYTCQNSPYYLENPTHTQGFGVDPSKWAHFKWRHFAGKCGPQSTLTLPPHPNSARNRLAAAPTCTDCSREICCTHYYVGSYPAFVHVHVGLGWQEQDWP